MPNVVKVAMRFSIAPTLEVDPVPPEITDVVVTWHVQALDSHAPPDEDDLLAIAGIASLWWTDDGEYADKLRDDYLASTVLADVTTVVVEPAPSDPLVLVVDEPGGISGAGVVAPLPPQCAYLISLRTSDESRRGRGRMYMPPLGYAGALPNHTGAIPEDARDELAAQAQSLAHRVRQYEGTPVQQWALAVYSRVNAESLSVGHFEIPDRICTQRRRAYRPMVYGVYDLVPPP